MSDVFYKSIKDEDVRATADNIAEMKKWDKDLAAVAAAAGPSAVAVIERALSHQLQDRKKETDAETKARIDRLKAQYHAAMDSGDVQRSISIKMALHREGVVV